MQICDCRLSIEGGESAVNGFDGPREALDFRVGFMAVSWVKNFWFGFRNTGFLTADFTDCTDQILFVLNRRWERPSPGWSGRLAGPPSREATEDSGRELRLTRVAVQARWPTVRAQYSMELLSVNLIYLVFKKATFCCDGFSLEVARASGSYGPEVPKPRGP